MEKVLINFDSDFVEKFKHDALFNTVIHALYYGQSPYKTIEQLIVKHSEFMNEYVNILKNKPPGPIIVPFDTLPIELKNLINLKNP